MINGTENGALVTFKIVRFPSVRHNSAYAHDVVDAFVKTAFGNKLRCTGHILAAFMLEPLAVERRWQESQGWPQYREPHCES